MTSLRSQLAATARDLHARGWVANHDGNVTVKDGARYLATPTATSKRLVSDRGVLELDAAGKVVGAGKVFGELGLHLAVYQRRPDVGAVIHAHPPHATAVACARGGVTDHVLGRPFIAEAVVSLGPVIPRLPFAAPGQPAVDALTPWCEDVDAALLGGHGVIAWGADLEAAFLRLELVEHLARIALAAAPLGGPEALPTAALPALLAARAKAGLGRAAERAIAIADELGKRGDAPPKKVVACAPAPHAAVEVVPHGGPRASSTGGGLGKHPDLAAVVREEIVRALRGG